MFKDVKTTPAVEEPIPEGNYAFVETFFFCGLINILRAACSEYAAASFTLRNNEPVKSDQ